MVRATFLFFLETVEWFPHANLNAMVCRDVNGCKLLSVTPRRAFVFSATGLLGGKKENQIWFNQQVRPALFE